MHGYIKPLLISLLIIICAGGAGFYIYTTYINPQKTVASEQFVSFLDSANPFATSTSDTPVLGDYSFGQTTNSGYAATDLSNLNATDRLARDFFTQYMNIQGSKPVTADEAAQIAQEYMSTVKLPNVTAKQYTTADIKTVPTTKESISQYQTALYAIVAQYWPKDTNEMTIMQTSFAEGSFEKLAQIKPLADAYQKMAVALSHLSVPELASDLHIQILNSTALYASDLEMISGGEKDPLSAMIGVRLFLNYQQSMLSNFNNLKIYFTKNS